MKRIPLLLLLILLITAISVTGCSKVDDGVPEETPDSSTEAETTEPPEETGEPEPQIPELPPMLPDYLEFYEINEDVVGHLRIDGTKINYPVLQGPNNDFYMDHNIYKQEDKINGSVTADYKNRFNGYEISDNTVLFGHNNAGNFLSVGQLTRYYFGALDGSLAFYKSNPVVYFDTMYEKIEWKVFAGVLFNTQDRYGERVFFWNHTDFANEKDFHDYIRMVMDRSPFFTDVDIEYGDQILSLMTCYYPGPDVDARWVVFARRVRPGESNEVDTSKAIFNRDYFRFGKSSGESTWDTSYLKSLSGESGELPPVGKWRKYE
ncbi:MAG: class B sortase [Oscillospiraceae bacterium]|nr:class B sortase [Oscillospiraceae bacterium]